MSPTRTLSDFVELLRRLDDAGFPYVVIGGCAVGAYTRFLKQTIVSADLDLLVAEDTLTELLLWAPQAGLRTIESPRPRTLPVAVLEWQGEEVNVLTRSDGLPGPTDAIRNAREIELSGSGLVVRVADPFDLLKNKLAMARPKDRAHVGALKSFIEGEVVEDFRREAPDRERLEGARRYLDALGSSQLEPALAERLLRHARSSADLRFLAHHAPTEELGLRVVARAKGPEEEALLRRLLVLRR